jgi:hypothetical protein
MELIEVKKFNLGAKWETLYNLWKCDVNFRDPQIQIHSSTFLYFYTYYTYVYPLFQNISTLFYLSFSFKSPSFILLMLSNGPHSSIVSAHRWSWDSLQTQR